MKKSKLDKLWLITLPHAGGSIVTFKGWDRKVNCNVLNVEYPGHWTRMKEPLVNSFRELQEDVIDFIIKRIEKGSAALIYGHSMGAILAWQITPVLIQSGIDVEAVFISASQNPGDFPEKVMADAVTDDQILDLIGYKKNSDTAIDDQFVKIFFPIIKNDFEICRNFICDGHYLNVPSIVCYGKNDIFTSLDKVKKWEGYTKLVAIIEYPGGHLFVEEKNNVEKITSLLNGVIEKTLIGVL